MPVPAFQDLYRGILEYVNVEKEIYRHDIYRLLADKFNLSEEDKREKYLKSQGYIFNDRASFAISYLKHAGLLRSTRRSHFIITERGKAALADKEANINNKYLSQFKEFQEFQAGNGDRKKSKTAVTKAPGSEVTPSNVISDALEQINNQLAEDLLEQVLDNSPRFLEDLAVRLLEKMGYGGERPGERLGKSGDEGVDGVINQDKLGLEKIYIQAKRYKKELSVGPDDIQKFSGALDQKQCEKGIFLTTSSFTTGAKKAVKEIRKNTIILIDGQRLAELMIEHNLGCTEKETICVKKIDSSFFSDDG